MNIVIEGPDNSGKSTLAQYLAQQTGMKLISSNGKPKDVRRLADECRGLDNVIFDRHRCVSDLIYSAARRSAPVINQDEVNEFYFNKPLLIYCEPGSRGLGDHQPKEDEDPSHVSMVGVRHAEILASYRLWAVERAHVIYRIGDDPHRLLPLIQKFNPVADVREFMDKFGQSYFGEPRALPTDLSRFREDFMEEEFSEYKRHARALEALLQEDPIDCAAITHHLSEMLDAIVDKLYVDIGTALLHGFDERIFRTAWQRVHNANMQKEKVARRSDSTRHSLFDVRKPPGWTAPDHKDLVEGHAHR